MVRLRAGRCALKYFLKMYGFVEQERNTVINAVINADTESSSDSDSSSDSGNSSESSESSSSDSGDSTISSDSYADTSSED